MNLWNQCFTGFGSSSLHGLAHGSGLFYIHRYIGTSGFWPRVRAPVFLSSLPRKTGRCVPPPPPPRPTQLCCLSFNPPKKIKSIELGPPTSKAFFVPLDHMQTEEAMICEVPCPSPAHRSFADPSSNILRSKLCTGAAIRPNFFGFSFFCFWIFSFCYSLLFLLSFLFYSNSSLLILLFLSLFTLLVGTVLFFVFLFFSSYILNCCCIIDMIHPSFWWVCRVGKAFWSIWGKVNDRCDHTSSLFYFILFFNSFSSWYSLLILLFVSLFFFFSSYI